MSISALSMAVATLALVGGAAAFAGSLQADGSGEHAAVGSRGSLSAVGGASPFIVFETDRGTFEAVLDRADAPATVEQLTALVGRGFYNGTVLRRGPADGTVEADGAMTQTNGQKPPPAGAMTIALETGEAVGHEGGIIAMVRSGQGRSYGSRFYMVTTDDATTLDGQGDCIVGRVFDGLEVAKLLLPGDRILHVSVHEAPENHAPIAIRSNFDELSEILQKAGRASMVVKITVLPDGAADYAILTSSGSPTVDDAMLKSMRLKWRWQPGAANGHLVAATLVQNIYAHLP